MKNKESTNDTPVVHCLNEVKKTGLYALVDDNNSLVGQIVAMIHDEKGHAFDEEKSSIILRGQDGMVKQYLLEGGQWDLCYEEYNTYEYGTRVGKLYDPDEKIVRARKKVNGFWHEFWHPVIGFDVRKGQRAEQLAAEAGMTNAQFNAILTAIKELF